MTTEIQKRVFVSHHTLLQRMLELELSKEMTLRIIDPVNATESFEELISLEGKILELLKDYEGEDELLRKLKAAGIVRGE